LLMLPLLLDIKHLNLLINAHMDNCQLDCQQQHPITAAQQNGQKNRRPEGSRA